MVGSSRGSGLFLGQRRESQVRLHNAEVGEQFFGLLVLDARVDNDVVAGYPVHGRGNLVLVARLQRVENPENLVGVAASRGGVRKDGANRLLGIDDED